MFQEALHYCMCYNALHCVSRLSFLLQGSPLYCITRAPLGYSIDKLYTQIGNVNRLHNRIEPIAALFWALGIVLAHIILTVLYGRGQLGSIRLKTSGTCHFLSCCTYSMVTVFFCKYLLNRARSGKCEKF